MFNKIFVVQKVGGANIEKSRELITEMKRVLESFYRTNLYIVEKLEDVDENTIAVPVGGDGTVLYVAKMLANLPINVPIIGFNLGQLGFLTDLMPDLAGIMDLYDTILGFGNETFKEEYRTMLSVTDDDGVEYLAVNDIVISNLYSDHIIKYDLQIGESFAGQHKANGVIVATPTGSTAYAMNVGGAIIEPDLDVIEVIPIAGMGMTTRPIITGGNNEIAVSINGKPGQIVSFKADGNECKRFDRDVVIKIKRHEKRIRLIHFSAWNSFERLTQKLNWNA